MANPERDDLRSEDAVRAEAEKVPPEVARFIREGPKRPRGRPKGSGAIDDSARLLKMAVLLESGEAKTRRKAGRMIAQQDFVHSVDSTADRLRKKYKADRDALQRRAREVLREQQESEERRVSQEQAGSKEDSRSSERMQSHSTSTVGFATSYPTGGSGGSVSEIPTVSSMTPRYLTEPIGPSAGLQDLTCRLAGRLPSVGLQDLTCQLAGRLPSVGLQDLTCQLARRLPSEEWDDLIKTSLLAGQPIKTGAIDRDALFPIEKISRLISPSSAHRGSHTF